MFLVVRINFVVLCCALLRITFLKIHCQQPVLAQSCNVPFLIAGKLDIQRINPHVVT
jgi:hypothetical protein